MNRPDDLEKWASETFDKDALPVERNVLKEQAARRRFTDAVDEHLQTVSKSGAVRLNHNEKTILHFPRNAKEFGKMVGQIVIVLAILTGLLGGTGAAAVYASQDDLPGDTLYPVKLWSEDVRLNLAADPLSKLDLSLDFTDERLAEIQQLVEEGVPVSEEATIALEETLDETMTILAEIPEAAVMDQVMTRLQTQEQLMIQDCDCLSEQLKLQIQDMLQSRIQAVQMVKDEAQYGVENQNAEQYQTPGAKEPLQQHQEFQETAIPGESGAGQGVQSTPMGSGPQSDGSGGMAERTPMGGGGQSGGGRH